MAHYAFLDVNNKVIEVITGIDENETIENLDPETWYGNYRGLKCKRTSYNNKTRKQFAGIGFSYSETSDVFIAPQPFASWTLDSNHDWQPPTAMPVVEGKIYFWNETQLEWVQMVQE